MPNHIGIIMDGNRRYAKEFLGDDIDEATGPASARSASSWTGASTSRSAT
ncbi:hypothetical protein [Candidatus Methanomethylophilus sp. 1R26]|nr:hypothetical protein [Candidatus Methanomethylophilus sp. 1R26]